MAKSNWEYSTIF